MSWISRTTKRTRLAVTSLAASVALVLTAAAPTQAAEEPLPEGGLLKALSNYVHSPDAVAGANDWSCVPDAGHPNPVILLPGTFANLGANFVKTAPRLKNEGYCVFATNYGFTAASLDRVGGLGHITDSAAELDAFVTKVREATGAAKVDIVGHSQGGNVPMWWMKKMGGAAQVAHYVGWAPSSNGTDLNGLVTLADALNLMGFATGLSEVGQFPGVLDQAATSDYTAELWADGDEVPAGPDYTVIMTKYDKVVTPYRSQALQGADVNNVLLQDRCPFDLAGHLGLFNDEPTLQLTLNALADGPADFQPECRDYGVPLL
ncbi:MULTISPECIES: esterase/lipase family protein [unclassified Streptomyces]|uniref:esterase/lipase family protein n=1 Tax=unclassified Streptomyces TaxID=2593676 RepID=UPI0022B72B82|nr:MULTISPECIES: alpha/beta fold hydrolase [unclassified Streptomyces]MCZ7417233.1 hypothetical protein [Streptomyces sp. WMMC897]MCZ7432939.1 hypothetical protein [Streptomyces sp. WMMC1477]